MKKSFSMAAAMMAAAVLSVSSFVSCDEEEKDENPKVFERKTFSIELPIVMGTSYGWEWTNSNEAAAGITGEAEIVQDDTLQVGGPGKEVWTFMTKKNGEEVLKFRYLKYYLKADTIRIMDEITGEVHDRIRYYNEKNWDESTVVKDTVITFKK